MAVIVLAGGESRRFGRPKDDVLLGGITLRERAMAAFPDAVLQVREEPRYGGPVAAIAAALTRIDDDDVSIIAVDTPFAPRILALLDLGDADAAVPVDADGRPQWLCARYRTAALCAAMKELGDPVGASMRQLAASMDVSFVELGDEARYLVDIDTPDQLRIAQELLDEPVAGALDHGEDVTKRVEL